jgi:Ulp1 family protease
MIFLNVQVFIPVNIKDCHWYLMVINASWREIQFLDSIGDSFDR